MVDAHEELPKDGFAAPLRLHNVLLALAGRLDDSALSQARELVGRSHLDDGVELIIGALIAGRIPVRPAEQRELALVLELSRSDAALADHLTVDESIPGCLHRFSRDNEPDRGIAEALGRTLQVLPDLRSVHAVWRNTPAGSVPGPLPQRVVLVEIGPQAHPPAVAFRVDDALHRAGISAVVEVTGPGAERTEYHEAALIAATSVWLASSQGSGGAPFPPSRQQFNTGPSVDVAREPAYALIDPSEPTEFVGTVDPDWAGEPTPQAEPGFAEHWNRNANSRDTAGEGVAQLWAAIGEESERGRVVETMGIRHGEMPDMPDLDLDDPQLSDRDRELLRELHAELAERERAEAAGIQPNGVEQRWPDGISEV